MNTPRPSASGFTFSSCLLCAQVPSGLPDLPDQGPGRRRGEGPRQRGRRPTEPGRLILVGGGGETSPPGVVRRGRVLEVDVRHKPRGVTTRWRRGVNRASAAATASFKKKNSQPEHEEHGTFTKQMGDTIVEGGFFFYMNKASAHLWNGVSAAQSPPQSLLFSSNVPSETWGLFLLTQAD